MSNMGNHSSKVTNGSSGKPSEQGVKAGLPPTDTKTPVTSVTEQGAKVSPSVTDVKTPVTSVSNQGGFMRNVAIKILMAHATIPETRQEAIKQEQMPPKDTNEYFYWLSQGAFDKKKGADGKT